MADQTILYSVDNSQYFNVVAQNFCRRITVQENYSSTVPPTQDLLIKIPANAASGISIVKGTPAVFTAVPSNTTFIPGQVVGAITTAAGSITVQQLESNQI